MLALFRFLPPSSVAVPTEGRRSLPAASLTELRDGDAVEDDSEGCCCF